MTAASSSGHLSKEVTSTIPETYTTVAIDQTRKTVGCDLYHPWFPEGERIPLPYWSESVVIKFLGAVSEDGETFLSEVQSRFASDVTVYSLQALQGEFGDHLHVVLDIAMYFASNQVAEFIDESQLKVTYLPLGSPDLNPVEECWRQFKRALGNRFFQSIDTRCIESLAALDAVSPPDIIDYFRPSVSSRVKRSTRSSSSRLR